MTDPLRIFCVFDPGIVAVLPGVSVTAVTAKARHPWAAEGFLPARFLRDCHNVAFSLTTQPAMISHSAAVARLAFGLALSCTRAEAQTEVPPSPLRTALTFELVETAGLCDDCTVVQVSGRFADSSGSDFWGFVARSKIRNTVIFVLDSAGGSLENAVTVGLGIRYLKASTVVGRAVRKEGVVEVAPGRCLSACTMAFVGGTRRSVPEASIVGVHSWLPMSLIDPPADAPRPAPTLDRRAVQNIHASNARYMAHLDRMGVDLRLLMRSFQTPYERMTHLHPLELKEYRVVTEESAIRIVPGRTRPVLALPRPAPPGQAAQGRRA